MLITEHSYCWCTTFIVFISSSLFDSLVKNRLYLHHGGFMQVILHLTWKLVQPLVTEQSFSFSFWCPTWSDFISTEQTKMQKSTKEKCYFFKHETFSQPASWGRGGRCLNRSVSGNLICAWTSNQKRNHEVWMSNNQNCLSEMVCAGACHS